MNEIRILEQKALRLNNTLLYSVEDIAEGLLLDLQIEKMRTYLELHGAKPIGPLIQYINVEQNEHMQSNIIMRFMLQSDKYMCKVDEPYKMLETIKVPNCLYARYIGPEESLRYAYDKLGVHAFENDIKLEGSSYTVFVDRNQDEEYITADIFMPTNDE